MSHELKLEPGWLRKDGEAAKAAIENSPDQFIIRQRTSAALLEAIRLAASHVMTPAERRAQRISMIVGLTGFDREKVIEFLDKHEGRA